MPCLCPQLSIQDESEKPPCEVLLGMRTSILFKSKETYFLGSVLTPMWKISLGQVGGAFGSTVALVSNKPQDLQGETLRRPEAHSGADGGMLTFS